MRYEIIQSHSARGDWETVESNKSWAEAWALFSKLKREHSNITYHII